MDVSGFGFEESEFCIVIQTKFMLERMIEYDFSSI